MTKQENILQRFVLTKMTTHSLGQKCPSLLSDYLIIVADPFK
ncbi:hypothetical protein D931_03283 [Enterococcus faecium 13.SD.W.09]|nr:hypothetical protein D931_03283 [Enterococcus faecium 13.SD.W.09]